MSRIGFSVYLSSFENQKEILDKVGSKYYVFTSFHIQEELDNINNYQEQARQMCYWLSNKGFTVIGDVSPKTLKYFAYDDVLQFASDMKIDILRIDYGFSDEEILEIAKYKHLAFNASTVKKDFVGSLKNVNNDIYAFHNFYPRPETGLDEDFFVSINNTLKDLGIKTLAFIPGDEIKRGPLFEGLPTLEKHRHLTPYIGFLDLIINYDIDIVFIGDIKISNKEVKLIIDYLNDSIIRVPVRFFKPYDYLYDQVFTIRVDSPKWIMRLQESREYSCSGLLQEPNNCIIREKGFITMDNKNYKRYSGEIQIIRERLPQDDRVNVIGKIETQYLSIVNCIKNGMKIKFIKAQ
ncbi:MAG TPA: MupG family TIM beta-alpha barrel fold protein [Haloplasmataceae bacterium]